MPNKTKFTEELKRFEAVEGGDELFLEKLDEFLVLLETSNLNSENIKKAQGRINKSLEKKLESEVLINELKQVTLSDLGKLEQLDKLEILLNNNHFDSEDGRKIKIKSGINRTIKIIIGLLFVTLGFAMIIMPAPPYFEMFTIFYFNPNDGVTLMDLISLIIVAIGVYIMTNALLNLKGSE